MADKQIWLFNIRPHNWRKCADGPPSISVHEGFEDQPWHGLNKNTGWAASQMKPGELAIVRKSKHGVAGLWEIQQTRPVDSQEDHEWEEEYEQFVYCTAFHREIEPPVIDTEFFEGQDFARFNAGANKLSDADAEKFLTHISERDDLTAEAKNRVLEELDKLGVPVSHSPDEGGRKSENPSQNGSSENHSVDIEEQASDLHPPEKTDYTVSRVVRNTEIVKKLKEKYDYRCQKCGEQRRRGPDEPYAEGHHIHPLGESTPGIDHESNILILCPNHHSDFDYGVVQIDPSTFDIRHQYESRLNGQRLMVRDGHEIGEDNLRFHNEQISTFEE